MTKEFSDFLKDKGVHQRYLTNMMAYHGKNFKGVYERQGKDLLHASSNMREAFDFHSSPEGFKFWSEIQWDWREAAYSLIEATKVDPGKLRPSSYTDDDLLIK